MEMVKERGLLWWRILSFAPEMEGRVGGIANLEKAHFYFDWLWFLHWVNEKFAIDFKFSHAWSLHLQLRPTSHFSVKYSGGNIVTLVSLLLVKL